MTNEEQKMIAIVVLADQERIDSLTRIVNNLIEDAILCGRFSDTASALRSDAAKIAASSIRMEEWRDEVRKSLGIE